MDDDGTGPRSPAPSPGPSHHLTGVFIGSHAIAEKLITRKQLRERSYRRLVHGV